MSNQQPKKKRLHLNPKLRTRMTGWSIPVWMVEQIEKMAQEQNTSASQVVRGFIAKELNFDAVFQLIQNQEQIKGSSVLDFDPPKRNQSVGWSMTPSIINYVMQQAEEAGELPSHIARQLIEEAIQHRFENSQSSQINDSVEVGV